MTGLSVTNRPTGTAFNQNRPVVFSSSPAAGKESAAWDSWLQQIIVSPPSESHSSSKYAVDRTYEQKLFEKLSHLSVDMSRIAMHLDDNWRSGIFSQLSIMLSPDEWEKADKLPESSAFFTFLRLITHWRFAKRPGIGVSADGNTVASWSHNGDRLTVECFPNDQIRWVLGRSIGGERETAAGRTNLTRLRDVISPYGIQGWVLDGSI